MVYFFVLKFTSDLVLVHSPSDKPMDKEGVGRGVGMKMVYSCKS